MRWPQECAAVNGPDFGSSLPSDCKFHGERKISCSRCKGIATHSVYIRDSGHLLTVCVDCGLEQSLPADRSR
jgi:hypothetical protein